MDTSGLAPGKDWYALMVLSLRCFPVGILNRCGPMAFRPSIKAAMEHSGLDYLAVGWFDFRTVSLLLFQSRMDWPATLSALSSRTVRAHFGLELNRGCRVLSQPGGFAPLPLRTGCPCHPSRLWLRTVWAGFGSVPEMGSTVFNQEP